MKLSNAGATVPSSVSLDVRVILTSVSGAPLNRTVVANPLPSSLVGIVSGKGGSNTRPGAATGTSDVTQFDVLPESAKFDSVPSRLLPLLSRRVVTPALSSPATP